MGHSGKAALMVVGSMFLLCCSVQAAPIPELRIMGPMGPADVWSEYAFPLFEKEYGVKITFDSVSWGDLTGKLVSEIATGDPPDIVITGGGQSYDLLQPLTPYLSAWSDKSQFASPLWAAGEWDGAVRLIPFWLDLRAMAYRKDLFAEYGFDPDQPPQSWDQLLSATKKLTVVKAGKVEQVGITLPWFSTYADQSFAAFLFQNGGSLADDAKQKPLFAGDKGVEAGQILLDLYSAANPEGDAPLAQPSLAGGNAAIAYGGVGSVIGAFKAQNDVANLGLYAPKRSQSLPGSALLFANGMGIALGSHHPDLAWKLIAFLSDKSVAERAMQAGHTYIYSRRDVADSASRLQPEYAAAYQLTPFIRSYPNLPQEDDLEKILGKYVASALKKDMPVKSALQSAAQEWQQKMDEWWSTNR